MNLIDSNNASSGDDEEQQSNQQEQTNSLEQRDQVDLESRGILIIDGIISNESIAKIYKRMLVLHLNESFNDPIQLILNSPGGDCDAGWALIDLIGFIRLKVKTIAMGEICSTATAIFIAGDERIMAPNCSAMIHQFSDAGIGNYSDLVAKGKAWKMESDKETAHLIKHSKYTTKAQIEKHILRSYDHWLSPQEMKRHGLCDEVFKPKPKK